MFGWISFQLNSPNRILLLHLSIVCLSLSILYLWILINDSIIQPPLNGLSAATLPESAAITTATSSRTNQFYKLWSALDGDITTRSPLSESIKDSGCSVNDLLIHLLQPIGLWTISCINFDRYYAICSPLHYNNLFTTKKVNTLDTWRGHVHKNILWYHKHYRNHTINPKPHRLNLNRNL